MAFKEWYEAAFKESMVDFGEMRARDRRTTSERKVLPISNELRKKQKGYLGATHKKAIFSFRWALAKLLESRPELRIYYLFFTLNSVIKIISPQ